MSQADDDVHKLGPVVLEQQKPNERQAFIWALFGVTLSVAAVLFSLASNRGFYIAIGFLLISLRLCLGAYRTWRLNEDLSFALHRYGIRRTYRGQSTAIFFNELQAVTYQVRRAFHDKVYLGMTEEIWLETEPSQKKAHRFQGEFFEANPNDPEEKSVVEQIVWETAAILARQFAQDLLSTGERVDWVPGVQISSDGLFITAPCTGKPHFFAWDQVGDLEVDHEAFSLKIVGYSVPAKTGATSARNFYPGYVLFLAAKAGGLPAIQELAREAT